MTLAAVRPSAVAPVIRSIAATWRVVSDCAFDGAGDLVARPEGAPLAGEAWLLASLTENLYRHEYLGHPRSARDQVDRRPAFAREDPELGRRLRAANAGRNHWEAGWRILTDPLTDGYRVVIRDGLHLHAAPDEVRPADAVAGDEVEVRFPAERPFVSPGFFLTVSAHGPVAPQEGLARWYMAVSSGAAPSLLERLTSDLDRLGVRYVAKVLNDPAAYPRPDATVLYVRRADVPRVAAVVLRLAADFASELGDRVPLFGRRLARGLAIADDPPLLGRPVSFGQHRCTLVARGLVSAGPDATAVEREEAIASAFRGAGIDLDRPHLNPGAPEFAIPEQWS